METKEVLHQNSSQGNLQMKQCILYLTGCSHDCVDLDSHSSVHLPQSGERGGNEDRGIVSTAAPAPHVTEQCR